MDAKAYLESIMPTREMVDHFVGSQDASTEIPVNLGGIMCNNAKSTFDPELGWVLCDGTRGGSVDGSRGFYAYEGDGARRVVHFPDRECRVHTYGNSFTHCDQVSDGESWQEYLGAHLQEPIRNFGIGGYSVYQAYRRMRKVEEEHPAEYIVLNVWDDDHFRNLDAFWEEFARYKVDIDTYLDPMYIGHHTPRGNFFFAWALKDRMCDWLDPKPLPYRT